MYLVVMTWISIGADSPCIVAETKEKAQEWIDKQMKDKVHSGLGVYRIKEIGLYEG
jgi:hypothetical protein